jgi:hypothetical protein
MSIRSVCRIFASFHIPGQLTIRAGEISLAGSFQGSVSRWLCGLALVLVFAFSNSSSFAHEWYSGTRNAYTGVGCCGGHDCAPVDAARIVETIDEFIVDGRWHFNKSEAMPSRDGSYHACIWGGKPRCFFIPMNV